MKRHAEPRLHSLVFLLVVASSCWSRFALAGFKEDLEVICGGGPCLFETSKYGTLASVFPENPSFRSVLVDSPEAAAFDIFNQFGPLFGVDDVQSELIHHVTHRLRSGGFVVKLLQKHSGVPVRNAQAVVVLSRSGSLLGIIATLVPTREFMSQDVDSRMLSLSDCSVDNSGSYVFGGLSPVYYLPGQQFADERMPPRLGYVVHAEGEGGPVGYLVDAIDCVTVEEFPVGLDSGDRLFGLGDSDYGQQSDSCVFSEFPTDRGCSGSFPSVPQQLYRRLWNKMHTIADKADSWYGTSGSYDWKWVRPDEFGAEIPYSDGVYGLAYITGCYTGGRWLSASSENPGYSSSVGVCYASSCLDIIGHEIAHAITWYAQAFSDFSKYTFNVSLNEGVADVIGEFFEVVEPAHGIPDWVMGRDTFDTDHYCSPVSLFDAIRDNQNPISPGDYGIFGAIDPSADSYKWFRACAYHEPLVCTAHYNIGILAHAAYGLSSPGTKTWYGVTIEPIGVEDTRALFWDFVNAAPLDCTYELAGFLLRSIAADLWTTSSAKYWSVSNVIDAAGIWTTSQLAYLDSEPFGDWYISSRGAPATEVRQEGLVQKKYMFITPYGNPLVGDYIQYIRGDSGGWHERFTVNLGVGEKTRYPVDAVRAVSSSDIFVLYRPQSSSTLHYFRLSSAGQVLGPYDSGASNYSGNGRITSVAGGIIISCVNSVGQAYYKYIPNSGDPVSGNLPGASADLKAPTLYRIGDYIWSFRTQGSGAVYYSRALSSCIVGGQQGCWSVEKQVPESYPHGSEFPHVKIGSPSAIVHVGTQGQSELHVTGVRSGPHYSSTIWTDSCFDEENGCPTASDRLLPVFSGGSWNNNVPRRVATSDAGEMMSYMGRLWLLTTDPNSHRVLETSARVP